VNKTDPPSNYNFWEQDNVEEFLSFMPPLKKSLYTKVSEIIEDTDSRHIMDYGCGEGNQLLYLRKALKVDLYDINFESAREAYKKFKNNRNVYLIESINEELNNRYDCVIVNMVWMCISNEKEINSLLNNIKLILKDAGRVIFSMTHPCFRDKAFSYFETDYSRSNKDFRYAQEGEIFNVFIRNEHKTVFQDYHYSLQFFFKKMIEFNFDIEEFIELEDEKFKGNVNSNFPPYIIVSVT